MLFHNKDKFFNVFKFWLPHVEVCKEKPEYLYTNNRRKFISIAFKSFCKKKHITIGYATSYIFKENGIAKQG